MFSFRRKPKKGQEPHHIRTSPSLPELNSQTIPWPENLVDVAAIQQAPASENSHQGAAVSPLQGVPYPIPFHKPFRVSSGKPSSGAPISSFYMSNPPSAFENRMSNTPTVSRYSQRRTRVPPTFNIMVVGGKGTGKTSLIRLLLETADISPAATLDQRSTLDRFHRGAAKPTSSIETVCVEICESRFDRVLLSVIDTPGLDFLEGKELKLERQVNSIIKYIDAQYADTLSEESKVVRKNRGDQHIHVCIYMIDPSSIMTTAERRATSTLHSRNRSETTISKSNPPDLVPDTSSGDDSDDEPEASLTMSPGEVRVIKRLSGRTNILPVIAHADSLTDEKLGAIKTAIRKGLADAGITFGIFETAKQPPAAPKGRIQFTDANGAENDHALGNGTAAGHPNGVEETERQSRPVIKLRPSRHVGRTLSRSRSRRDLSVAAEAEDEPRPMSPDATDKDSIANVRFSAHILAKSDLLERLPFALITPEGATQRQRRFSIAGHSSPNPPASIQQSDEDGVPPTPASVHSVKLPYTHGPPEDLRGVFTRKFRWGTIDVLDPSHCDFAALRTAVLSTHLKLLKTNTNEVLYEKYRTEKLLARRATRNISDDDRQRLLEDLGL